MVFLLASAAAHRSVKPRALIRLDAVTIASEVPGPIEPAPARLAITPKQSLMVWSADSWTCRYCRELVFFPPAFRSMARRFGNHGYFHPSWKADQSPLLIERGASVDHIVAVTRGGEHDLANFVTACWECNLKKSNRTDWQPSAPVSKGPWDGLLAVFKGITTHEPDSAERRWLSAIRALGL
jgi:hypothetical protein